PLGDGQRVGIDLNHGMQQRIQRGDAIEVTRRQSLAGELAGLHHGLQLRDGRFALTVRPREVSEKRTQSAGQERGPARGRHAQKSSSRAALMLVRFHAWLLDKGRVKLSNVCEETRVGQSAWKSFCLNLRLISSIRPNTIVGGLLEGPLLPLGCQSGYP